MTTDFLMRPDAQGIYDIELNEEGDIANGDFFDTSMIYSLLGERRALPSEVPKSSQRRGWIGNEFSNYENGSKLWLYEQSKLTRSILNSIESEAINSLQWMIDDGYAVGSISARASVTEQGVTLLINIQRPNSEVEQRFFELWNNTGISSNAS